jgi:hypothetical protein
MSAYEGLALKALSTWPTTTRRAGRKAIALQEVAEAIGFPFVLLGC